MVSIWSISWSWEQSLMVTYLVNYFSTIESSTGVHSYLVFRQCLLDRMTISFTGSGLLIPIWWHVIVVHGQSSSLWSHSMTREIKMLLQMACMSRKNREVKLKSICFFLLANHTSPFQSHKNFIHKRDLLRRAPTARYRHTPHPH